MKWLQRWQNHASFVGTLKFQLKNSSVSKWFQRSQNFTSFVGTFKSQPKNTVYYWNDYKDERPLHSLLGHSKFNWQNLTSLFGQYRLQWKKQFSIQMISKMTEPYIVCGDILIPTEKDSSVLNWSQRLQNFTSLWGEIQTPTKKDSLVLKWLQRWQKLTSFVGIFQFPTEEDSLVLK